MNTIIGPCPSAECHAGAPNWWLWWNVALLVALVALGVWAFWIAGRTTGRQRDDDNP